MAVHVAIPGLGQRQIRTEHRVLRGYAASRQAYDRRRRRNKLTVDDRAYRRILLADPCSLCGGFCGQMAVDHIDALERDGAEHWTNYTSAGRPCNAAKRDKSLLTYLLDRARKEDAACR